jgi:hypothetical protein
VVLRNAATLVLDRESIDADRDTYGAPLGREVHGVLDQVLEQDEQFSLV